MPERALSIQQQLICCFIHTYTQLHGFPPTMREIAAWVGYRGMRSLQRALASLEEQGYLHGHPHSRRSLTLTAPGRQVSQRWQLRVLEVA